MASKGLQAVGAFSLLALAVYASGRSSPSQAPPAAVADNFRPPAPAPVQPQPFRGVASVAPEPPAPTPVRSEPPPRSSPTQAGRPPQTPAQPRPVTQEKTLYVSGRDVPMREEPRRDAPILDRLNRGMDVTELERRPDWVKVRHPITAREGWMSARLVRADRPVGVASTGPQTEEVRPPRSGLTDVAIAMLLIQQSRANYPGSCPCPDDVDRAGRRCGRRSAHSKPSGRSPLCYPEDVSVEAIAAFRRRR